MKGARMFNVVRRCKRLLVCGMFAALAASSMFVAPARAQDCPKGHWETLDPPIASLNYMLVDGELFTHQRVGSTMHLLKHVPGQSWQFVAEIPGIGSVTRILRWQNRFVIIGNFLSVNGVPQPSPALIDATTYQLIPIAPADQALLTVPAGGPANSDTQFSVMNGQLFRYAQWSGWPSVFMAWTGTSWRTLTTTAVMNNPSISPTWMGLIFRNGNWYSYSFVVQPGPDYTYYYKYNAFTDRWDYVGLSMPSDTYPFGGGEISIGSVSHDQATNSPTAYGFVNYRVGGNTIQGWSFGQTPCSSLSSSFSSRINGGSVVGPDALVMGAFRFASYSTPGGCAASAVENMARVNVLTGNVYRIPQVAGNPGALPLSFVGAYAGGMLTRMNTGDIMVWKPGCGCQPHASLVPSLGTLPAAARLPAIAPLWYGGEFIAFGGRDSNGNDLGDTLVSNGGEWSVRNMPSPPPRADHAMATLHGDTTYLFGGKQADGTLLSDLWAYSGLNWYMPTTTNGPSARGGHTMAAWGTDLYVFGGFEREVLSPPILHKLTSTFFTQAWTTITAPGPSSRFAHVMAFDESRRGLVVFGGRGADNSLLGDTWFFNGAAWTPIAGPGPSPRDYATLHWDEDLYGLRLAGGRTASGPTDEQWLLRASGWQLLPARLPGGPRWAHASASDVNGNQIIAGGLSLTGASLDDTLIATSLPLVLSQPQHQSVSVGQSAIFSVQTSSPQFAYQWLRDGNDINVDPRFLGVNTPTLTITDVRLADGGDYSVRVSSCAGSIVSLAAALGVAPCDSIDFNNNGAFPEDQDVIDFFTVLAGGECSAGNSCNDIDFNNNGAFPEDQDVIDFFHVLAGGNC
jgi:hypothetical protein